MFRRNRKTSDFGAEVEAHIQLEMERLREQGLSREKAYLEARRAFGNATGARERFYESRRWLLGEALARDLGFGARMLAKHPGSTAIAALTLALVIGMNTAVFSVIHTALFKPLPVSRPDELVMLTDPDAFGVLGGVQTGPRYLLSYAEFVQLRDHATTTSGLCASGLTLERWQVRVSGGAQEEARGRWVSENYFSVLGVEPAIGHFFGEEQGPYAVISYDYWQRRFGGNLAVIGTPMRFYRTTVTVVGVAARGFRGETVGQDPDVWLPIPMQPLAMPGADMLHDNTIMWLHVFGRRKPGITIAKVQAEMSVLFRRMLEAQKGELNQRLIVRPGRTGVFLGRSAFSVQWTILSALAGLVMLLACANIANLLLARAAARSREIAIRISIGASRGRLIRQLLTESLLLAGLGGGVGVLVAAGGSRALVLLLSHGNDSLDFAAGVDPSAFAFTACATLLTGVLFGLAPALRATRRVVTSPWQRLTFAKTLVVAQVALSLLLVVGAGLFLRTLWNLRSVALGYPRDNLLLLEVDALRAGYEGARVVNLDHALAGRLRRIPGVRGVTWSAGSGLFTGTKWVAPVSVEGFTPRDVGSNNGIYGYTLPYDDRGANMDTVGPGYFSALGIPILLGREIGPGDQANSQHVCVINEAFARRFFAGRNPIGKHVTANQQTMEVVGVSKNARDYSLRGNIEAKLYMPADQSDGGSNFQIRTNDDPNQLVRAVREAILAIDSGLPVKQMKSFRQVIAAQNAQPQLIAQLCAIFGIVALLLAASGVYGVLSHSVVRRTNEIGIRMALGAGKRRVARMILRETGFMVAAGAIAGVVAAAASTRMIASR